MSPAESWALIVTVLAAGAGAGTWATLAAVDAVGRLPIIRRINTAAENRYGPQKNDGPERVAARRTV